MANLEARGGLWRSVGLWGGVWGVVSLEAFWRLPEGLLEAPWRRPGSLLEAFWRPALELGGKPSFNGFLGNIHEVRWAQDVPPPTDFWKWGGHGGSPNRKPP